MGNRAAHIRAGLQHPVIGSEVLGSSAEDDGRILPTEPGKWRKVIRAAGIEVD